MLMKTTTPILGFQLYKWNTSTILSKLKWPNINHLIISERLRFIHKPIFECMPPAITNFFVSIVKRWIGLTMEYKNRAACREIFMPSIVNPIHLLKYIVTVLCKIVAIISLLQNSFL